MVLSMIQIGSDSTEALTLLAFLDSPNAYHGFHRMLFSGILSVTRPKSRILPMYTCKKVIMKK